MDISISNVSTNLSPYPSVCICLSTCFSLVAQYFDVSADVDVDVDVAEAGVVDVEAVDGVNAGNVKSRLSVMYLPIYPSIHLYLSVGLFLCLSIHLYIVSSVIWTEECISFLTSPQFSFYCLKEDVSFFLLLFFLFLFNSTEWEQVIEYFFYYWVATTRKKSIYYHFDFSKISH